MGGRGREDGRSESGGHCRIAQHGRCEQPKASGISMHRPSKHDAPCSLLPRSPVLGVIGVVGPVELNDVFFLLRQGWWEWLAGTETRQGLRRLAAAKAASYSLAVLAPGRVNSAQFGGMSLQVALCRHSAHANGPLPGHAALARGGRDGRRGSHALDFIARSLHRSRCVMGVVLPSRVFLSCHELPVDLVQLGHCVRERSPRLVAVVKQTRTRGSCVLRRRANSIPEHSSVGRREEVVTSTSDNKRANAKPATITRSGRIQLSQLWSIILLYVFLGGGASL